MQSSLQLVSNRVSTLQEQLQQKDRQLEQQYQRIKKLTAALENMTASLKATLALHIGTMQQNLLTERVKVKLIK